MKWIPLTSVEQLMQVAQTTHEKPVFLFKHSTRCSISAMAKNNLERNWSSGDELCNAYYLDLLQHRDVSNKIEEITGITHQSPQAIVLKGSEIIYDESHSAIDARRIESTLKRS
ncbi:MAG: bacillithiol system redox-active protein YtxJ [Bacteroidetes bacterium]|nr:MAG: bacillithiol system redox-active protein YtxJ [Bacteroidota bacterium]TNE98978.1 MAG: bacillithiol system redox-active protein YtxJ [Bacteroidota bacterium]